MKYFRLFLLVLVSCPVSFTMNIQVDMHEGRRQDVVHWEEIAFHQDHSHMYSNQPHWQWTNLTYDIPYSAKRVQLTALDRHNSTYDNEGSYSADVPYFAVDQQNRKIHLSFMWWGIPWGMHLGFGY